MATRSDLRVELKKRMGILVRRIGDISLQPQETQEYDQYLDSVLDRAALWVQAQLPYSLHFESTALLAVDASGAAPIPKLMQVLHEAYNWDGSRAGQRIRRVDPFEFVALEKENPSGSDYLYWSVFNGKINLLPAMAGQVQVVGYRRSLLTPSTTESGVIYQDKTDGSIYFTDAQVEELLILRTVAEWLMDIGAFELANGYIQRTQEIASLLGKRPPVAQQVKRRSPRWL